CGGELMGQRGEPASVQDWQPLADGATDLRQACDGKIGVSSRVSRHELSANQAHSFRRTNIGHGLPAVKKAAQLLCRLILTTAAVPQLSTGLVGSSQLARMRFFCQ